MYSQKPLCRNSKIDADVDSDLSSSARSAAANAKSSSHAISSHFRPYGRWFCRRTHKSLVLLGNIIARACKDLPQTVSYPESRVGRLLPTLPMLQCKVREGGIYREASIFGFTARDA